MSGSGSVKPRPKRFLYLNRRAPHGTGYAHEGLEALLMGLAFDQEVCVLFMDDGVYQLKRDQQPESLGRKNFAAGFRSLELYDMTSIFVEAESLTSRGLLPQDLLIDVTVLSSEEIGALIDEQDVVYSF